MVGKCTVWTCIWYQYQYLWPRDLKRGSASSRLLGMRVRIPPVARIFATCECCVLSRRCFCVRLITCPEESYRMWCVWVWSWSLGKEEALAHLGLLHHGGKKKLQTLIARSPNCVVVWNGRSKPTTWTSPHLPSCPHLTPKLLTFSSLLYWFVIPPTSHHHAD